MEVLLALLVAGGCAALGTLALAAHRRQRRGAVASSAGPGAAGSEPGCEARELDELRAGDVVLHDSLDLFVTGGVRLDEREVTWIEHRLQDEGQPRWLVVRATDLEHALLGAPIELELGAEPSECVEHERKVYRLERCGQALASCSGETPPLQDGECRFWDYARPGADRLWVREQGQVRCCVAGQRVRRHLLCVLPGGVGARPPRPPAADSEELDPLAFPEPPPASSDDEPGK